MPALPLRRALLLIVPLVLVLAGCNAGQGKPGVPADVGDTNQGIAPPAGQVEPYPSCPDYREPPCSDGTGCQPSYETIIAPGVGADFSWTHDCQPDAYSLNLFRLESSAMEVYYWTSVPGSERSFHLASGLPRGHYYWILRGYWHRTPTPYGDEESYGGDEATTGFLVGITCEEPEQIAPPVNGAPEYTLNMPESPQEVYFRWRYDPVADCLPDRYEGQIAEDPDFTTNVMEFVSTGLYENAYSEPLYRCHTYYWRVRGMLSEEPGPWSETWSFIVRPEENCQVLRMPIGAIEAVAAQDASCRHGPSTAYGIAGYAAAGERRMIVGRNADGTWFQTAEGCYINRNLLTVVLVQGTPFPQGADVGDLMSLIPEVPDPPTPTVPTIVCKATMGQGECAAAGGMWVCATKCGFGCTESCTCGCP